MPFDIEANDRVMDRLILRKADRFSVQSLYMGSNIYIGAFNYPQSRGKWVLIPKTEQTKHRHDVWPENFMLLIEVTPPTY